MRTIEVILTSENDSRVKLIVEEVETDVSWQALIDRAVEDMQHLADAMER